MIVWTVVGEFFIEMGRMMFSISKRSQHNVLFLKLIDLCIHIYVRESIFMLEDRYLTQCTLNYSASLNIKQVSKCFTLQQYLALLLLLR